MDNAVLLKNDVPPGLVCKWIR